MVSEDQGTIKWGNCSLPLSLVIIIGQVCDFHRQDLKAQQGGEDRLVWGPLNRFSDFADDMVLSASSACDFQDVVEQFAVECKVVAMRFITSNSKIWWWWIARFESESLAHVKKFKYLRVLLTSEVKKDLEINRQVSAAWAITHTLYHIVPNRELILKAKFSI